MSTLVILAVEVGIFAAVLAMIELGFRTSRHRALGASTSRSVTAISAFVQTLMSLSLAFWISDSAARLDWHRRIVLEEANAAFTAWQRLQLLPSAGQAGARDLLRRYVDARIEAERALPRHEEYAALTREALRLQDRLWSHALTSTADDREPRTLVLPALDNLVTTASAQTLAIRTHVTPLTIVFTLVLVLLGALLVGVEPGGGDRNWPHRLVYALVVSLAISVILDMEYPRSGLIATRAADVLLVDVRRAME